MIKTITLYIKFILKILKISLKHSKFSNKFLFYKNQITIFKNCFQKLIFKIILENSYQIGIYPFLFSLQIYYIV